MRGLWLVSLACVLACSSCARSYGKRGSNARARDASADWVPRGEDRSCDNSVCGAGQVCTASDGEATCTPSCDSVECPEGQQCQIEGRFGVCMDQCEPECGAGQRCTAGECIDKTCDDLACGNAEVCVPAKSGGGYVCVDNHCDEDLNCADNQSCRDGICVGDKCSPGVRRCAGQQLFECAADGRDQIVRMTCSEGQHVQSKCLRLSGPAHCSCGGDWDCPEHSYCLQGRCEGTGRTPHCLLPPAGFAAVLPSDEPGFPWGGNDRDGYTEAGAPVDKGNERSRDAKGHPFPRHSQVTSTPVVANLDDDNGDGLIDEQDLPEIVFMGYCDENYFNHGVLRAVHGGGPNAGKELFARCDDNVWHEDDPITDADGNLVPAASCDCNAGDFEPTGSLAVGDLDDDGSPEIVVTATVAGAGSDEVANTRVLILDRRGQLLSDNSVAPLAGENPVVTLANLDGVGLAEIIIGARVFILSEQGRSLHIEHALSGKAGQGINKVQGGISCVADLDGDGRQEIIAGATAYKLPKAPRGQCPSDTSALDDDARAYCSGELRVMWSAGSDGFCAVADVLSAYASVNDPESWAGPSAPLDGEPDVIVIGLGRLQIYAGRSGELRFDQVVTNGAGGAPNVDDFDGDGFPEIGTAGDTAYVLQDLQPPREKCPAWPSELSGLPAGDAGANPNPPRTPPDKACKAAADCGDSSQFTCGKSGRCVCLHNGWTSKSQDASSNATGSSVFDFNGDGAAEVVYNDECYFRIYDGSSGTVYQRLDSQSPTRIEYPVVADVDNDGNAEIVISAGNAHSQRCPNQGKQAYFNGIRVIGDPSDRWVSARRIWNQHTYHVTNVLESGAVPIKEVPSWLSYANRTYNSYRSNVSNGGHVAPDLTVPAVNITSPGVSCGHALGHEIRIDARVVNQGDLRVGQNVSVRFSNQDGKPLGEKRLGVSLEPGAETRVTLDYHMDETNPLPKEVTVVADAREQERECSEDNNAHTTKLDEQHVSNSAELSVSIEQLDNTCPLRHLRLHVENTGTVRVEEAPVHLYAGMPSASGALLALQRVGPIEANGTAEIDSDVDTAGRDLTVFAVVNADSSVVECDESNNTAQTEILCSAELQ